MRCAVAVLALLFELPDTRVQVAESYPATGVNAEHATFYLLLLTRLTARRNVARGVNESLIEFEQRIFTKSAKPLEHVKFLFERKEWRRIRRDSSFLTFLRNY